MFHALDRCAHRIVQQGTPWTNVYGLARTLLAVSTLITLITNDSSTLFIPLAMLAEQAPYCTGQPIPGLFCVTPSLEIGRYIAIGILLVVASGWRPRFTGILHWWVAASLQWSASLLDGGDQITMNLTLLLIPVTLCDARRSHFSAPAPMGTHAAALAARLISFVALAAVRVQVAVVYYAAGTAKYQVEEWGDGTALYYWLSHPVFGAPEALRGPVDAVIHSAVWLPLVTWSVLVLEVALAAALFMRPRHRGILFVAAALFHVGIALLHGILTFAIAMEAALILYLIPVTETLDQVVARARAVLALRRARNP